MVQPHYDRSATDTSAIPAAVPGGQVLVASYASYAEAERAVDRVAARSEARAEPAVRPGRRVT